MLTTASSKRRGEQEVEKRENRWREGIIDEDSIEDESEIYM